MPRIVPKVIAGWSTQQLPLSRRAPGSRSGYRCEHGGRMTPHERKRCTPGRRHDTSREPANPGDVHMTDDSDDHALTQEALQHFRRVAVSGTNGAGSLRFRVHAKLAGSCVPLAWWDDRTPADLSLERVAGADWLDKHRLAVTPAELVRLIGKGFICLDERLQGGSGGAPTQGEARAAITGLYYLLDGADDEGRMLRGLLLQLADALGVSPPLLDSGLDAPRLAEALSAFVGRMEAARDGRSRL